MNGETSMGDARAVALPLARTIALGPPARAPIWTRPRPATPDVRRADRHVGVIFNKKARHNLSGKRLRFLAVEGVAHAAPETHEDLRAVLADFAAQGVDALVIDGGDGTVRDIATIAPGLFPGGMPLLSLVPSGKTNALALDLGIPIGFTVEAALAAIYRGRTAHRAPLEILRDGHDEVALRGFILGAGAFVRATGLAQHTHSWGAFNGVAIALSIAGTIAQTFLGRRSNIWRRGEPMRLSGRGVATVDRAIYILLASTLTNLPIGIKPLGAPRPGLKLLVVDAPPRRMIRSVPALLAGHAGPKMVAAGYHHIDADEVALSLSNFVLDGEVYPGGGMTMRRGAPIGFAVP